MKISGISGIWGVVFCFETEGANKIGKLTRDRAILSDRQLPREQGAGVGDDGGDVFWAGLLPTPGSGGAVGRARPLLQAVWGTQLLQDKHLILRSFSFCPARPSGSACPEPVGPGEVKRKLT